MAINWKSPWVIGGIGLGVVALLLISRSAGSGSATGASIVAADQTNAQLAGLSTSLQQAQIAANTQLGITNANDNAAMAIAADQAQGGVIAGLFSFIGNSSAQSTALNAKNTEVSGSIANQAITTNATLTLAPQLASIQEQGQLAVTSMNDQTTMAVAPQLATIAASNQQALASITGNTATTIAGINADAKVNSQLAASGGSIISSVAPYAAAALALL